MPEKRRKSKNWKMSKKNARIKAMRLNVPAQVPPGRLSRKPPNKAFVIRPQMLDTAAGADGCWVGHDWLGGGCERLCSFSWWQ
jgi:hypothetical protein